MSRLSIVLSVVVVTAVLVGSAAFAPTPAPAATMSDADKAALKQATDSCKAQVKEQARFQEMSWYARHKAVKNCIAETLAHR